MRSVLSNHGQHRPPHCRCIIDYHGGATERRCQTPAWRSSSGSFSPPFCPAMNSFSRYRARGTGQTPNSTVPPTARSTCSTKPSEIANPMPPPANRSNPVRRGAPKVLRALLNENDQMININAEQRRTPKRRGTSPKRNAPKRSVPRQKPADNRVTIVDCPVEARRASALRHEKSPTRLP